MVVRRGIVAGSFVKQILGFGVFVLLFLAIRVAGSAALEAFKDYAGWKHVPSGYFVAGK